jgi:ABC-2 type transport system permease protein
MPEKLVSIRVEHLTCIYPGRGRDKRPVVANDDLTFEVNRGEIFGLLGPNGSGKTTLVCQLLGLIQPTSGTICLESIDVMRNPELVKRVTGFLPQTGLPMRYVEVERALHYTGRLRGQTEADAKRQTRQLIDELGLSDYARRYVHKLSGGMLRLTNFAMALMGRPQILVLDEPTNELDPQKRRIVWDMIARLNHEQGVTCILVTHNVLEAERVIQRVAVMQQGKIVAFGTPGELKLYSDGNLLLEFRLRDDANLDLETMVRLQTLGRIETVRAREYILHLAANHVAEATDLMLTEIGLSRLDDFRLSPPSLEDVYLELDSLTATHEEV